MKKPPKNFRKRETPDFITTLTTHLEKTSICGKLFCVTQEDKNSLLKTPFLKTRDYQYPFGLSLLSFENKIKKQLIEELNLRLAAMENEITTLQNQITNLSQPTCTNDDLTQMKMLISKFPISNLQNAQYLHATQLQVANLSEQLEHERNLRRQQDGSIQQLQTNIQTLQTIIDEKLTTTQSVEQPVNTPLFIPPSTEPASADTQKQLAELKPLK